MEYESFGLDFSTGKKGIKRNILLKFMMDNE